MSDAGIVSGTRNFAGAVELRGLTKVYDTGRKEKVAALTGLDLNIESGARVSVLGPNGAGKSTLFRILAGLTLGYTGDARLFGEPIDSPRRAYAARIGYLPQNSCSDPYATVRANLLGEAALRRLPNTESRVRVEEIAGRLGLSAKLNDWTATLSGGMRRRLEIAMTLVHRPALLLLDEPSAGIDPDVREALWADVLAFAESEEVTVIYSTHDFHEAEAYACRVLVMDEGQIAAEGTVQALKQSIGREMLSLTLEEKAATAEAVVLLHGRFLRAQPGADLRTVRVSLADADLPAEEVLDLVRSSGISIRSWTVAEPSLADAYFAATRKHLRMPPS